MGVRVVSVTSGKGGVGKSHLAINVAMVCARQGHRVLLMDADGGLSNLDVLLGVNAVAHLGDLLAGKPLDEVVQPVKQGVWLLAGAPGERKLATLDDETRAQLLHAWSQLVPRFDVVVVDVGPGAGDDVLFFASAGEQPVLVLTDEPTSLADAVVLIRALERQSSVRSMHVVVNGVRTSRSAQAVFARLLEAVPDASLRLQLAPHIPDDQNVRRAAMLQKPLVELAPTSPASRAFERLTTVLLESSTSAHGGPWLTETQLQS
ncbi:MAG: P-loop NTPase [Archangium sp.]|nr:P-loop NTPase [Archangium sp.]